MAAAKSITSEVMSFSQALIEARSAHPTKKSNLLPASSPEDESPKRALENAIALHCHKPPPTAHFVDVSQPSSEPRERCHGRCRTARSVRCTGCRGDATAVETRDGSCGHAV